MELRCSLQMYEWGKVGENSEAALLARANNPSLQIQDLTPYAELWMGTHPNGPSRLASTGENLHEWIQQNPQVLGEPVRQRFGVQLPFLFKVLSVNKALSIQVHPSKIQAEELHRLLPDIYKDPNHKPEMALALSPFEALCGFRPLDQIKHFLNTVPELRSCVGQENVETLLSCSEDTQQEVLGQCFQSLMTRGDDIITTALTSLLNRISSLDESSRGMHLADLVERLHSQFPGDVGVFGPYLFNHVTLQPGESLYLAANEPHAYLSGDCVECMACSDNTVRAGLTPKLKDVPTLCSLLSYICEPASSKLFVGTDEDEFTTIFRPPVPDFAVVKITVPEGRTYTMTPRPSASIAIVTQGCATSPTLPLHRGSVFFLPADDSVQFTVTSTEPLLLFQAMANV
ncbi:mannose-6-phosphate isomerase [Homalodisca vitripennis]|uniref:mannose-6-phosphate isomerase n=1 Tax=Homalodisca vitripennis TaxID=197043 RepID=UPI001EEAD5FC|nr:mannose-6-phosphate isomerase [Homalodisca vitripennis]